MNLKPMSTSRTELWILTKRTISYITKLKYWGPVDNSFVLKPVTHKIIMVSLNIDLYHKTINLLEDFFSIIKEVRIYTCKYDECQQITLWCLTTTKLK